MSDPRILTPEQLAAIQGRCDSASPAPWRKCGGYTAAYVAIATGDNQYIIHGMYDGGIPHEKQQDNARFMAKARQDIPALLASHAALTEQLAAKDRLIHEYQDKDVQE
jgi:hypothetical protein